MNLRDAAEKAVNDRDAVLAGKVADTLRFKFGMKYNEVHQWVNNVAEIDIRDWETLMYEADTEEP